MGRTIKNNYKIILEIGGLLLVAIVVAFLFEDDYRQFIRFLFSFFNGDKIQFVGKGFHLFASGIFVATFGIFASFSFLLLMFSTRPRRIKRTCVTIIIFFAMTILITALDSKRLIIECTACDDGIRRLPYNQITYDTYFIISLTTAIAYLLMTYLSDRKRLRKTNETKLTERKPNR